MVLSKRNTTRYMYTNNIRISQVEDEDISEEENLWVFYTCRVFIGFLKWFTLTSGLMGQIGYERIEPRHVSIYIRELLLDLRYVANDFTWCDLSSHVCHRLIKIDHCLVKSRQFKVKMTAFYFSYRDNFIQTTISWFLGQIMVPAFGKWMLANGSRAWRNLFKTTLLVFVVNDKCVSELQLYLYSFRKFNRCIVNSFL